jgi:hypothetical protein
MWKNPLRRAVAQIRAVLLLIIMYKVSTMKHPNFGDVLKTGKWIFI